MNFIVIALTCHITSMTVKLLCLTTKCLIAMTLCENWHRKFVSKDTRKHLHTSVIIKFGKQKHFSRQLSTCHSIILSNAHVSQD